MKSPDHIQDLINLLSKSSIEDYNTILKTFNFSTIDFKPFESWSSNKYTRNCLCNTEDFELLLLCWEKGQETEIHGHDGEDCWVYLLEGEIEEVFFTLDTSNYLREERSQVLLPKVLSFMNDKIGFHKLKNSDKMRSVSLHLYAKPIKNCRSYDTTTGHFITRQLSYDSFNQTTVED